MSAVDDFKSKFDSEGYFRDQNGTLNVVFATRGWSPFFRVGSFSAMAFVCVQRWIGDVGGQTRTIRQFTEFASFWISTRRIDGAAI